MSRDPLVPALGDVLAELPWRFGPCLCTASLWRTKLSAARRPAAPKKQSPVVELKRASEKLEADNDGLRREVDGILFTAGDNIEDIAKAVADHAPAISPTQVADVWRLLLRIAERRKAAKARRGD
jgi:hypothetical protein